MAVVTNELASGEIVCKIYRERNKSWGVTVIVLIGTSVFALQGQYTIVKSVRFHIT